MEFSQIFLTVAPNQALFLTTLPPLMFIRMVGQQLVESDSMKYVAR